MLWAMDVKRMLGLLLTLAGVGLLIWAAIQLMKGLKSSQPYIMLGLGAVFFFAGIGLVRTLKDTGVGPGTGGSA